MYRKILFYIFFAAFLSVKVCPVEGQASKAGFPVSEAIYVHTDKQVYVAGEPIRYKIYLVNLSGEKLPCSKIIYFNLTGPGTDNRLSWRINIDSSWAVGSLPIPEDIKPGMYVLNAYTNWMRNNPSSTWFSDRIIITSLKTESNGDMRLFRPQTAIRKIEEASDIPLEIKTDKSVYLPGDKVQVELGLNDAEGSGGNISLSVFAASPFDSLVTDPGMAELISSAQAHLNNSRSKVSCTHKIENRGFILTGRIISGQNANVSRCDVWLAVRDSVAPRILYSPVDNSGNFRFFLNRSYDNKELIIQLCDPSKNADCKIEIFNKSALPSDTVTQPYFSDDFGRRYLSTVKNIRLIEAVYSNKETYLQVPENRPGPAFLKMPDRVIIPSEYADLRNFKEIAGNIIPEVRFGTRREEFYLEVLSPNVTLWKDNIIVMLNGVPFTDLAYVSTLGTKEIRRIEVIQPGVLIGDITLPGLVSIYTYDGKIPENYLKSKTVRFQNNVIPVIQYNVGKSNSPEAQGGNFPEFSNCIYWDPLVKISSGNRLNVEFPAGLLTGKFIIKAEGITVDGIPLSITGHYEVKEQ